MAQFLIANLIAFTLLIPGVSLANTSVFYANGYGQWGPGENGYSDGYDEAVSDLFKRANHTCLPNKAILVSDINVIRNGGYGGLKAGANFTCENADLRVINQVIRGLEELANSHCKISQFLGSELTYECTNIKTGKTQSLVFEVDFKTPAMSGIMLKNIVDIEYLNNVQPTETAILDFMQSVSEASFKYFLEFDNRTTWGGQIAIGSIVFKDPQALQSYFQDLDQTSAKFVEVSYKKGLRIYIGYFG